MLAELSTRDSIAMASQLFSDLNIAVAGKSRTTHMEWNGKANGIADPVDANELTTDNERNPLRILAQSRHVVKTVQVEPPVESLITTADRKEIEEFATKAAVDGNESTVDPSRDLEPHAIYMCSINERHPVKKERYLPHKTILSSSKKPSPTPSPTKPESDAQPQATTKTAFRPTVTSRWENTAATPPALRNAELVALSLGDSIEVQRKQQAALKALEQKQTEERLVARQQLEAKLSKETDGYDCNSSAFVTYRDGAATAAAALSDDEEDGSDDGRAGIESNDSADED